MNRIGILFLGLAVCATHASSADKNADDVQLFQGAWQPVFVRNPQAQDATAEELLAIRFVVKGNEFTFTNKGMSVSGTFTIDPAKTPKTIDFVLKGSKPEVKFLGIYEIRGERRLSCFAMPKEERPRELRPTAKGYLMFEWKPAAQ